jgi:amidase
LAEPASPDIEFGAFVPGLRCRLNPSGSGALNGLTFAVTDLIDVAGTRTGGGNPHRLHAQRPAAASAPVVEVVLAAGATLVGKTVTDELGFSLEGVNAHYGTPVNPACPGRIPGGSSSGAAVAVAGDLVDFAIGTDAGGSVRIPASFVGVFGFRPTHGAVSLTGVLPFAPSYDTVGWFASNATTLAAVGKVLLPTAKPPAIRRFVLARDAFALADADVSAALRRRCEALDIVDEVTLFDGAENEWLQCCRVLQGAEVWQQFGYWIRSAKPRFGNAIARRFAEAASITPSDIARCKAVRASIAASLNALFGDGVGLILPTAPCVALRDDAGPSEIAEFDRRALTLAAAAGHAGLPQISVPAGRVDGCPIGLSILAPSGHDRALLEAARSWPN